MREIASEPAWQHFLKQNRFQPVSELAPNIDSKFSNTFCCPHLWTLTETNSISILACSSNSQLLEFQ